MIVSKARRGIVGVATVLGMIALGARDARANEITYCDFASVAGMQLNGVAAQQGTSILLTPDVHHVIGSAFRTTPVPFTATTSFHTHFRFLFSSFGADGLTFAIQSMGATAIGDEGEAMGYGAGVTNPAITPSVVVEFDTYFDTSFDPDGNHVAIMKNGDYKTHLAAAVPSFEMRVLDAPLDAWVDYNAATKRLDVFLSKTDAKPATPLVGTTIDVFAIVGASPFVGFTAGTGLSSQNQSIQRWVFSTTSALTECVACTTDASCTAPTPRCAPTSFCVQCLMDGDCGPKSTCDLATNTCTGCQSDADCSGKTPACPKLPDTNAHVCSECSATNTSGCKAEDKGAACLATDTCGCNTDPDCGGNGRVCDTAMHLCKAGPTTPPASTPDGGASPDAGAPQAVPDSGSSGCSCSTAVGSSASAFGAMVGVLLAAATVLARARRRPR
jgi:hypothetical protein